MSKLKHFLLNGQEYSTECDLTILELIQYFNYNTSLLVLEYNNLKLSLSEIFVTFKNKPIKLGPKEFKLLTILMERPGHIFSRTKLLDLVWGHGVYVEERTVDVHMSRLRKAIKSASGDKNIIRTVRDGGYGLFSNQEAL